MHVCVCVCVCVCVFVCMCVHVCVFVCVCLYVGGMQFFCFGTIYRGAVNKNSCDRSCAWDTREGILPQN